MKKLVTSLVCGTVLSMSLLGSGYASSAADMTGLGNNQGRAGTTTNGGLGTMGTDTRANPVGNTMNGMTGTRNNNTVSPLTNNNNRAGNGTGAGTGNFRATATNANRNAGFDWGWLGLAGLLGLAGMRSGTRERR